jgi:hypothetical protein
MTAAIITRATAGTGATVKGAPLTNAEVDNNFLALSAEIDTKAPSNSPTFVTPILGIAAATALILAAGLAATPALSFEGDANTGMWSPAADTIAWSTTGSERIRLNSVGNVGIGTTAPDAKVHIAFSPPASVPATGSGAGALAIGPAASYGILLGTLSNGSGYIQQQRFDGGGSVYSLLLQPNGGNVGIGTTSPFAKLEVFGSIRTTPGSGGTLELSESNASRLNYLIAGADADGAFLNATYFSGGSGALIFRTINAERMRITQAGNVGIGTTAPAKSFVVSNASAYGIELAPNDASGGYNRIINYDRIANLYRPVQYEAEYHSFAAGTDGNVERLRITSAGNVGIGTSTPGSKLVVAGSTAFTFAQFSTAHVVLGSTNASGSLFINTPSLNSSFTSGLGVDGSYSGTTSTVNLSAVGVCSGGNYGGELAFRTSFEGATYERMRITKDGNVGIGVTAPVKPLEVRASTATLRLSSGSAGYFTDFINAYDSNNAFRIQHNGADILHSTSDAYAAVTLGNNGNTIATSYLDSTVVIKTASSERLRVNSAGNVGIGTTDASTRLRVEKPSQAFGGTTPAGALVITNVTSGAGALELGVDSTHLAYIQSRNRDAFAFYSLLLNPSGGGVCINTTASVQTLTIGNASSTSAGINLRTTQTDFSILPSNSAAGGVTIATSWVNGGQGPLIFTNAVGETMRIASNGNVGIGTSSPQTKLHALETVQSARGATLFLQNDGALDGSETAIYMGYGSAQTLPDAGNIRLRQIGNPVSLWGSDFSIEQRTGASSFASNLFIQRSTGNVGIGTTSPPDKLSVNGDIGTLNGRDGAIILRSSTNYNYTLQSSGDNFRILEAGDPAKVRFCINYPNGNVGIGTSSTLGKLSILKNSVYTNADGDAGIHILSNSAETALALGADDANNVAFIQSIQSGVSYSTRPLSINPNGGNVGIGTVNPLQKFVVSGGANGFEFVPGGTGSYSIMQIYDRVAGSYGALLFDAAMLAFRPNGSEKMRLDAAGNLGIGTTGPVNKLQSIQATDPVSVPSAGSGGHPLAVGSAGFGCVLGALNNGNGYLQATRWDGTSANYELLLQPNGGNVGIGTASVTAIWGRTLQVGDGNGASSISLLGTGSGAAGDGYIASTGATEFQVIARTSTDLVLGTNDQERLRISSTGQVGIGFTTPVTAIYGTTVRAYNAGNGATLQIGGTSVNCYFYASEALGLSALGSSTNNPLMFFTNDAERLRITAGGNVLVGSTSNALSTKLFVSGDIGIKMNAADSARALNIWNEAASGQRMVVFWTGSGQTYAGGIECSSTTTAYLTSSDVRMKKNIADADDTSQLIDAIQVRKFDWKETGQHQRYGFIAQELAEVAPEAVGMRLNATEMMSVDYSKLVPMLVKELQSLRARLSAIELH